MRKKKSKSKRRVLTDKLDVICSLIVRHKGSCERCGKEYNLAAHHIFTKRGHPNVRHSLINLVCLCSGCHMFWAHSSQYWAEYADWIQNKLTFAGLETLKAMANISSKTTILDLETKLSELEDAYESLKRV